MPHCSPSGKNVRIFGGLILTSILFALGPGRPQQNEQWKTGVIVLRK